MRKLHHCTLGVDTVQRKDVLCQIDPHGSNVAHGTSALVVIEYAHTRQSWHFDAVSGRGSPLQSWTSHHAAELIAKVDDASLVSKYSFGTGTADFHVCSRCGAVPFVTSTIDDHIYAVVNVNTLEGIDPSSLTRAATNFDGEGTAERRKRNWIQSVRIAAA